MSLRPPGPGCGAAHIVVANRTADRAGGSPRRSVAPSLTLLTCWTGRPATLVISLHRRRGRGDRRDLLTQALARRGQPGRPLVLLDLAMPRDVRSGRAGCPGPAGRPGHAGGPAAGPAASRNWPACHPDADVDEVRAIVARVRGPRVAVHAARVAPTVVALRTKAAKVVDAELARLAGRAARRPPHAG